MSIGSVPLTDLAPLAVMLPVLGAAVTFMLVRRPRAQITVTVSALVLTLVLDALLLAAVWDTGVAAVHLGGWPAPLGISLVVDRLSALMLVVSALITLAVLLYASAQGLINRDEGGPVSIFHPTFLILVAGVSNAFLAGDLFNLYVGFEILLTSSYVLLTMGGTAQRIRAGITYVVVSVLSSVVFLIAIAMIYAATGTVNMADLAVKLGELPTDVQMVLHVLLLVGFGIKAAVFPLSFWLPDSYPTAPAPVTAVFAGLLTKVGVYAMIRTETLLFPGEHVNALLLVVAALTMVVGILGALAQTDIKRILSFILVSHIGYMIFGLGLATEAGLAATVYYVAHHITVQTALFLITGRVLEHYQSGAQTRRVAALLAAQPTPFVEVHPLLAHRLGIEEGDQLDLRTARATVTAPARITDRVRPDTVFMPFHFAGAGSVNRATNDAVDPISSMPEFKVCAVDVAASTTDLVPEPLEVSA